MMEQFFYLEERFGVTIIVDRLLGSISNDFCCNSDTWDGDSNTFDYRTKDGAIVIGRFGKGNMLHANGVYGKLSMEISAPGDGEEK